MYLRESDKLNYAILSFYLSYKNIQDGFPHTEKRYNVEKEVKDMEKTLERILVSMQEQMANLGSQMNSRFDIMEKRIDGMDERFDNLTTELRSHFKQIETKLDNHEKLYQVVSNELNAAKIDIEYLSKKTGVHDKEINQLKKTIKV
jgi:chromosome segregation ATPase